MLRPNDTPANVTQVELFNTATEETETITITPTNVEFVYWSGGWHNLNTWVENSVLKLGNNKYGSHVVTQVAEIKILSAIVDGQVVNDIVLR